MIVIVGVAVRLSLLDPSTLHSDEALYAAYGLHVYRTGDVLLLNWVGFQPDKHPLFFWLLSAFIGVFGNTPLAIRLPSLLADGLLISSVALASMRLAGPMAGLIAAALASTSLLGSLYGASVFIDSTAVALGFLSVLLMFRSRPALSGSILAIAGAMKPFSLVYLPLVFVVGLVTAGRRIVLGFIAAFVLVFSILMGLIVIRQAIGAQTSILGLAIDHSVFGLSTPSEWLQRLHALRAPFSTLFVPSVFVIVLIGQLFAIIGVSKRWFAAPGIVVTVLALPVSYLVGVLIVRFPIYDRYFLYLVPLLCISSGVGYGVVMDRVKGVRTRAVAFVVLTAAIIVLPLGGLRRLRAEGTGWSSLSSAPEFSGYEAVCAWLSQSSDKRDIWNRQLSWHLAYCLQGRIGGTPLWYPNVDAIKARGSEKYRALLVHTSQDDPTVILNLRSSGWTVEKESAVVNRFGNSLSIYEIAAPSSTVAVSR